MEDDYVDAVEIVYTFHHDSKNSVCVCVGGGGVDLPLFFFVLSKSR